MNIVLVVAAHPDDEALGCGATMAKHAANGDKVYTCFMTDGVGARSVEGGEAERRKLAATRASEVLGVEKNFYFDFPDNKMDTVGLLDLVQAVESVIYKVQPSIIYTHFQHDLNIDHQLTHRAVMTACRPQMSHSVDSIYSFEVLSSTEWAFNSNPVFHANVIIDVVDSFASKISALNCYKEEMRTFPHSRTLEAVKALGVLRGATHGFRLAEAFQLERMLRQ